MTIICNSKKTASLMMALTLLGSAMAPLGNAAERRQTLQPKTTPSWAIVCENRNGKVSCYIQE